MVTKTSNGPIISAFSPNTSSSKSMATWKLHR
jgi:hypothetical protein